MSELRDKQRLFLACLGKLLTWADTQGLDLSAGELWRPPEMALIYAQQGKGIANSLHTQRLAVDLNLFINGELAENVNDYKPLGDYWKLLHPDCRWGGDFTHRPDADHFSITHQGIS